MSPIRTEETAPLVYVILVNYRGVEDTLACLESLMHVEYPNFKVLVVDNNSGDESVAILKKARYLFSIIESDKNLGFSGGNNLGIQQALRYKAQYIWLLNNDTTVDPHALSHLVSEAQTTGGLAGSLLLYPDQSYQQVGHKINWLTGRVRGISQREVRNGMPLESLSGASMLIPRRVFETVGFLDESYFLYFEDVDYCLRAAEKGFACTLALGSRVYHKEGASTGKKSPQTQYYYQRNRLLLLSRYAGTWEVLPITIYTVFRILRSIIKGILGQSDEKRQSAKLYHLATQDFMKGVTGPCPHNLTSYELTPCEVQP